MIAQADFLPALGVVPDCFPTVPLYTSDGRKVARIIAEKHRLRRRWPDGSHRADQIIYKPRVEFTDGTRCWPLEAFDNGEPCEYLTATYCRHRTREFITV